MKIIYYTSLIELTNEAAKNNLELFETAVSYSFRLFENKNCIEVHILYK